MVAIASCCHRRKLSSASLNEIGIENLIGVNAGEESEEEAGEASGAAMEEGGEAPETPEAMDKKKKKMRWLYDTMLNNLYSEERGSRENRECRN